jgi:site-specific recombinase XerD
VRLQDLDFDRKQLKVVQGKGKKDRYAPLSIHLIRGLQKHIKSENPQDYLFNGQPLANGAGDDFDNRYSQRGVQWGVKQVTKAVGIQKEVHVHTLRQTYATHLLEDGMDIITLKDLLGHQNIELLPEPYFHVVFTLPDSINSLAIHQPKIVYDTLFEATWERLEQFSKTKEI